MNGKRYYYLKKSAYAERKANMLSYNGKKLRAKFYYWLSKRYDKKHMKYFYKGE